MSLIVTMEPDHRRNPKMLISVGFGWQPRGGYGMYRSEGKRLLWQEVREGLWQDEVLGGSRQVRMPQQGGLRRRGMPVPAAAEGRQTVR